MVENGVPYRSGRRKAARVLVPVAVAAIAAAGIGLVPALASDSGPSLPSLTADQVVAKTLGSDVQALSGTVQLSVDLGVPTQLLGAANGMLAHSGGSGGKNETRADPKGQIMQMLGGDHTFQVAADGPDRQRIGVVDRLSGYELIHNGDQLWAWDSASNEVYHLTSPQQAGGKHPEAALPKGVLPKGVPTTPQELAKQFLTQSAATTSVTVDGTATVAGQKAYQLSVKPKQSGSTIGDIRISVDADNGVPLAVVVKSESGSTILDTHFSSVSFAKPDAKTFQFTVPKGARVTEPKADAKTDAKADPKADPKSAPKAGAAGVAPAVNDNGWLTVVSGKLPAGKPADAQQKGMPRDASAMLKTLGKPVKGGSLISTKALNVLLTDDGRYFAGAVTLPVLQSAAGVK